MVYRPCFIETQLQFNLLQAAVVVVCVCACACVVVVVVVVVVVGGGGGGSVVFCVLFIMGIPIPVIRHLYSETVSWGIETYYIPRLKET